MVVQVTLGLDLCLSSHRAVEYHHLPAFRLSMTNSITQTIWLVNYFA